MKKLLLLFALATALNSLSQVYPPSGTVHIISVEPAVFCRKDTITIHFKFFYSGINDTIVPFFFHYFRPQFSFVSIWQPKYYKFYGLTKNVVGSDTVYSFKTTVPATYSAGPTNICINSQLSCIPIKFFECFDSSGLEELNPDSQKPVYYDLYGNIIDPRKNEIMIEKIGNKRRKIVLQ